MGIVPFSAFGTDNSVNWFRASVGGCSLEDIQQMIPRMRLALSKLK
jgi:aspartate aminotransferase